MPKKVSKSAAKSKRLVSTPVTRHPILYYRLHALLHTVQTIASFEDQLCTLLHEIKMSSTPAAELTDELENVLAEMPSLEYEREVDAVRAALAGEALPRTRLRPSPAATQKRSPGGTRR